MELAAQIPILFLLLKYVSAAYIIWLAWRVANMRLSTNGGDIAVPGFIAGLWIHPLNPKAWAMIVTGFTNFVGTETTTIVATATIAGCLFFTQLLCHPVWAYFGDRIARMVAGKPTERYLMWLLAFLTVSFVAYALLKGEL